MSFSYVAQLSCLLACLLVERAQAVEGIVAMRICCIVVFVVVVVVIVSVVVIHL